MPWITTVPSGKQISQEAHIHSQAAFWEKKKDCYSLPKYHKLIKPSYEFGIWGTKEINKTKK